jgi:tetratricopeptide (TPR) repeat protein
LQAIAELPEEPLRSGLAHLQAAEFLYEANLFPELEYTFKHALTHEVTYGSLLQERRRALHASICEAIERLYPDRLSEHVERLAHHAFRGESWGKALPYLRQAGAKAFARRANREAVACSEQALMALKHLPESRDTIEQAIELRFDLRTALFALGELEQILDYLREAEALAEAVGDQRRLAQVSSYVANLSWAMGDYDRAVEAGHRGLAIAGAIRDFAQQVVSNFALGEAYHALGDYRQAKNFTGRNVQSLEGDMMCERCGMFGFPSVLSRTWLVWSLAELGEFTEGIACGEEAVRIAEVLDHPFSLSVAYWGVGCLYLRRGGFPEGIAVLERCLGLCQVWDYPINFPWTNAHLGYAYALSGRLGEALPLLEQAVEQAASMKGIGSHSLSVALLSEARLLARQLDGATQLAGQALELSRERKERGNEAWILRLLGEIHSHGDPPDAEKVEYHYHQAFTLAEELGMRPVMAHCRKGLGSLYRKTGREGEGRAELSQAVEMYRKMEMTFWLEKAELALAKAG